MALFTKNQIVSFLRNAVTSIALTPIIAVVESVRVEVGQFYVIEHSAGWTPDSKRIELYGLDITKKYLFVKESELTAIP